MTNPQIGQTCKKKHKTANWYVKDGISVYYTIDSTHWEDFVEDYTLDNFRHVFANNMLDIIDLSLTSYCCRNFNYAFINRIDGAKIKTEFRFNWISKVYAKP